MKLRRHNRLVVLFLIISLFSAVFVFAQEDSNKNISKEDSNKNINKFFSWLKKGSYNVIDGLFGITFTGASIWELAVTKLLLMVLIFTIVYGIADFFILEGDGKSKTALKVLFSIVISYLSVVYLAPEEIFASLIGWGAMAVTLTSIIPFIVILGISWNLTSDPNPAKIFIQKLILGIFAVYLAFRVIFLMSLDSQGEVWPFALPIYGAVFAITTLMLIFHRTIQRFILTSKISGYIEISDSLNKEDALAQAVMLREKADALEKVGDKDGAAQLRNAAIRLENRAKKSSE